MMTWGVEDSISRFWTSKAYSDAAEGHVIAIIVLDCLISFIYVNEYNIAVSPSQSNILFLNWMWDLFQN